MISKSMPTSGTIDPEFPPIRVPNPVENERNYSADFVIPGPDADSFIVGCYDKNYLQPACLVRMTRDGKIDRSFGDDGYAYVGLETTFPGDDRLPYLADIYSVSDVLGNGYLVRLDIVVNHDTGRRIRCPALARFDLDGRLVPEFGNGGTKVYMLAPEPSTLPAALGGPSSSTQSHERAERFWSDSSGDLHVLADGRLLMLASANDIIEATHRPYVLRLHPNGEYDETFNGSGIMEPERSTWFRPFVLLPDGNKTIISGSFPGTGFIARYDESGALDRTFGHDGYFAELGNYGYSFWHRLIPAGDGNVACVGRRGARNVLEGRGVVVICKIDSNGRRDPSFGDGRTILLEPVLAGDAVLAAFDAIVDDTGRIVVGGRRMALAGTPLAGFIARRLADGTPDTTFGPDGVREFSEIASVNGMIEDGDLGYVASTFESSIDPSCLMRYLK